MSRASKSSRLPFAQPTSWIACPAGLVSGVYDHKTTPDASAVLIADRPAAVDTVPSERKTKARQFSPGVVFAWTLPFPACVMLTEYVAAVMLTCANFVTPAALMVMVRWPRT